MDMGEFRYPVYTLDSKADLNYGEAQDEKLPGFRVEAEPIRVMIGNSFADIQLTTEVRVQ